MMNPSSFLIGFMVTPLAKLLPLVIVFFGAFVLLKKLQVPRWQLWTYVGAFAGGLILLPFSAMSWIEARETYGAGSALWVSSILSLLSLNIGPLVLLIIAIKARAVDFKAVGERN